MFELKNINKNDLLLKASLAGFLIGTKFLLDKIKQYSLKDKVVLIAGGSRGLGLVIARELIKEEAKIVICARDEEELQKAKDDLIENGAKNVLTVKCDLKERSEIGSMVNKIHDAYGQIDVLVNNASIMTVTPFEDATVENYEELMDNGFWATLNTVLAVFPEMKKRGEGRIVNISSIGGKISVPHLLPYSASKFAIAGFSTGLRAELAKYGIIVTSVFPGLMRTGSPPNAFFKGQHNKEYKWFSIFDSLPLVTVSAETAAREIIAALKSGRAELVFPLEYKIAAKLNSLFPEASSKFMEFFNSIFLPESGSGGPNREKRKGYELSPEMGDSNLTVLSEKAKVKNNE
jgi:short-subunit dehydrogenase